MSEAHAEVTRWDPEFTERAMQLVRPFVKAYHRAEASGLESFPDGGALVVSNHSGGLFALDVPVLATAFYEKFGYTRPIFTLSHDMLVTGAIGQLLSRAGFISASHESASAALGSGGIVVVFPGGDYDAYRPTSARNTIDFGGRTGYVKAALASKVPIVPMVSIGGQENQIYLTRGAGLARVLRVDKLMRVKIVPISVGAPFGLTAFPINVPLPTKIVTKVLPPIDIEATFGPDPDIAEVDEHVRAAMQVALDDLARARRFPVLG
ncbi:1-acyl-sn-glycerol-3-phosphate acyltransferase [Mycobacterium sp. 236(2023)]|uniref:1-acyl-sn-glycerol-3-phosphate acyltransferase n=1 Tax=Mycobacterium sp. 236(2023) TaxID=3038163 RepID=UPI00241573E1|nr:1-acyl-sn-glycerol-3-phosphate acyltransferase [Mycobacterium sp. 236(2023)]MDG4669422.1 1-acyl-sn-glycerol-3-phosphate acyltransferase [Mycobacterium sp. 236(2023)]